MLDLRSAYWDPRFDTSTRTSVVRPVGNPQQVYVQSVDAKEFYNQANDMQPSRVSPLPGLLHTRPAVLRPDPIWAHRWPDIGPYRGMTAAPFAWEKAQMDGLGAVTQAQRDRYLQLMGRSQQLSAALVELRSAAATADMVGRLSMIEGQLEGAHSTLTQANQMDEVELDMAMDEVELELGQVEERIDALGSAGATREAQGMKTGMVVAGALVVGALFWLGTRRS